MTCLAVFDIDGTLTDTNAVDDRCFREAISDVLNLHLHRVDWSSAPHVTDSALLVWLAEQHGVRRPLPAHVVTAVMDRFVALLEAARERSAAKFRAIAGATGLFAALRQSGWTCAVATGGWERSARLKLRAAGFDATALPFASATDAVTRPEIMRLAAERAQAAGGETRFERIVSVGDALWDVHAAGVLQWPFVGIATGDAATALRASGATAVLPNFVDRAALCLALARATPPPRPSLVVPVV